MQVLAGTTTSQGIAPSYVLRVYPRNDWGGGPGRLQGLVFEGSDTSETTGYATLYTFPTATYAVQWYEITVQGALPTWARLRHPSNHTDVAEFEIWVSGVKITPVSTFWTDPYGLDAGINGSKAFDGNTATFFASSAPSNGYVGMKTR